MSDESTPGANQYCGWYSKDNASNKPYLEITYTAVTSNIKKFNGIAYANLKKINGIAIANVKKLNGIA
jgi:hypothetical protein